MAPHQCRLQLRVRAAKVVVENPQASDSEIAKQTGVSRSTMQRARKQNGLNRRIGRNDRTRSLPAPP
jgi:hypothetical protein